MPAFVPSAPSHAAVPAQHQQGQFLAHAGHAGLSVEQAAQAHVAALIDKHGLDKFYQGVAENCEMVQRHQFGRINDRDLDQDNGFDRDNPSLGNIPTLTPR